MNKRDYQAIAQVLYETDTPRHDRRVIASGLSDYFAKENVRFDRDRFFVACGL